MTSNGKEPTNDINAIIKERGQIVVDKFKQTIALNITDTKLLAILNNVAGYWSDYFRPALSSFSCEAVGRNSNDAVCLGMMLTSIDAGISIHDDILDRTTKKRFRRTVLGEFGLDCALLVGDLLITKGWSMIGEMIKTSEDSSLITKLTKTYSNALIEMCEAQFFELECRKSLDSNPNAFVEALAKGNAGIKACMELGAILGGGTEAEIQALSNAGKNIALLFALKDELKDTLNLEGYLVHRLKFESVPLPVLLAAKSSSKRRLHLESIIRKRVFKDSEIEEIISLCIESLAFQKINKFAAQAASEAKKQLNNLTISPAQIILNELVENVAKELVDEI